MINVGRYRLVYILKLIFLIPAGFLIPLLALGMKEHSTTPVGLYIYLVFFLFEVLMLALPLFEKIRSNIKFKFFFMLNILILMFNYGVLIFDSFTSDIDGFRIFLYIYVSLVSIYLMKSNYKLFNYKF